MASTFRLPDVGEGLTEAEIVRWLVDVGDRVEVDQPIVEIETDKALMEIPSPFAGTVLSRGAEEGTVVDVGSMLVVIGDPDEELEGDGEPEAERGGGAEPAESAPIVGTISSDAVDLSEPHRRTTADQPAVPGRSPVPAGGSVQTLPMIRRMASELGVDLTAIEGSGPGGRITREDVRNAADAAGRSGSAEPEAPVAAPSSRWYQDETADTSEVSKGGVVERVGVAPEPGSRHPGERLSATRRAIAEHMERSWREIPHVTTFERADVGRLLEAKLALERRHGQRVSLDALVVAAVTAALESHPLLASHVEGDRIVAPESMDVGVAVDTPEGLLVAVVTDPGGRDLVELTGEIDRLAADARERRLPPERMRGQCFTVSNIGAVGGWYGTPIVPHGTSGILSVGRATDEAVVRSGAVRIATLMPLSLSYDHRLVDGAAGRAFIGTVVENLEEPALFLA